MKGKSAAEYIVEHEAMEGPQAKKADPKPTRLPRPHLRDRTLRREANRAVAAAEGLGIQARRSHSERMVERKDI